MLLKKKSYFKYKDIARFKIKVQGKAYLANTNQKKLKPLI